MQLAAVIGTVTATTKDAALVGKTLLLVDFIDGAGKVITPSQVAVDTVGAGVGDRVLAVTGSAARMAAGSANTPTDSAIIAIVDRVNVA